jgi:magnesium transporter
MRRPALEQVMGLAASALYGNLTLGLVMAAAMLINLVLAPLVGIAVPAAIHRLGRDPAFGSSVLLTFTTDSVGFFIFLGLATVFGGPVARASPENSSGAGGR